MITIKRIDGTPIMEVQERDDSKYTRVLMGEHSVRIRFDWNVFIPLPYGSFIEWKGKRFSIWGEYTPVQREGAFEYDIPFEAEERELNNYLFFYLSAGKMEHQWKLTAPIEQALKEVQGNLDRIHGKGAWVIRNEVGATPTKLLEFDSTSVFDALTKIAEAYGTEWRAEGRTLFFGRMSEGERVRLSLGNEASRFEPQGDTAQLISRLYAFGSSRNVKSSKRLTLPDDTPFISGTLRGKEAVKIFDDVYPKYNGTISSVSFRSVKEGNIYTIADSALKITQDKLLAGQTLKATFESGALNGLTFDLSITSQGYEIVPNNEYGGRLPSDTLKPAVGDKYVPHGFDIDLVGKEYVPRARVTLKEKAFRWLQENNEDTRDVEVVLNPIAVAERSIAITIGKPITLVNALAGGDKVGYITKMEYPLYSPESVTIVVGKAKPLGFIERLKQEGKDEASLVVHELVTPQLNAQQKAVLDVQAMITDAESSATAKTTQALREAKAYADGKVTHFRGGAIPTGYKQGDLWTLTSAWNGFKQGSILTATQDEVIGQYNPTHWKEEVRYTDDTAIRTLSIGGRNLVRRFNEIGPDGYRLGSWLFTKPEQWEAGLEYTLSFNLGTTHNDPLVWLYVDKYDRGIARIYPQGELKRGDDGLFYGRYICTFKPTQDDIDRGRPRDGWDGFRLYLGHTNGQNANDPKAKVDRVKLERGNKDTDYTEAPEDVADAIKKVDTDSTAKANQALNDAKAFAMEEDEKREKALRAEIMQDYLRQVIKDGSTLIKGGLLATNVIALKSTNGKVSSYIDGNEANNIAFAAGVTDAFTANEKRAVEITHDGNARFGQMHLNGHDGVLSFAPIGSAESYLNIGGVARNLEEIVDKTLGADARGGSAKFSLLNPKGDVNKDNDLSDSSIIVDYFNVPKDGTLINFSGTYSLVVTQGLVDYSAPELMDSVLTANDIIQRETALGALEVKLIKQGERGEEERAQILYIKKRADESGVYDDRYSYNITLEKGRYKVVANCYHFGSSLGESSTTANVSLTTALPKKNNEVHIGSKAMYAVFGRENYLHVSEEGTTIKGRTDMPGILAAGIAKMNGRVSNAFGAKVNRQGYDIAFCERQRDDTYKVYHTIGHSNYSVQITPRDTRDAGCVLDISDYYFTCCFYGTMDTDRYQHDFHYLCIGPNTK